MRNSRSLGALLQSNKLLHLHEKMLIDIDVLRLNTEPGGSTKYVFELPSGVSNGHVHPTLRHC